MTVAVADIYAEAAESFLHDTDYARWSEDEHLDHINAGQRMTVFLKPDANTVNDVYQLSAGTKQSLPDGSASFVNPSAETLAAGIQLLDIIRNMGTDGATPGDGIIVVDKIVMDLSNPGWHSDTAAAAVQNYTFNDKDPKHFYVYPPQPATGMGWVEVAFSALVADVSATTGNINLGDEYRETLLYYDLFRCYMKDSAESQFAAERATYFWNLFATSLGRRDLIQKDVSPNKHSPKPSPSIATTQEGAPWQI
jgi:hypothetical protein